MGSFVRRLRKRKRCLGEVRVLRREDYQGLELNAKVELIRSLIPLGLMHVQMLLDEEVEALAGARYAREDGTAGTRHGSNPGTVVLDGQRVPIRVPRVRSEQAEIPLRSYQGLHGTGVADDSLLRRVLYGISCRNYEAAARAIPGAIGLSSSSVSRAFIEASAAKLKEFQERALAKERYVALFLDGKSFADATLVIALGVTADGRKRFLGFVETDTENDKVLSPFLHSFIERASTSRRGCWWSSTAARGCARPCARCSRRRRWCSAACGTSARTWSATSPRASRRAGAGDCSTPTTGRATPRRRRH